MDLKPFKQDIDELINEFSESESSTFREFKKVWSSKKFTFIFEASPSTNRGFFMQSLYAHCISYVVSSNNSLRNKLGGLYCLYCLYHTQPFKPPFKIYLSLLEMRQLKSLVIDSKNTGVEIVTALVKSMLERDAFLFGSVGTTLEGSASERVDELTDIQNAQVRAAYDKLFADSRLELFVHVDLSEDLEVGSLKKRSLDYALAKEQVIKEAGRVVNIEDVKHIAENKRLVGDFVEKAASDWEVQKEMFYKQIGYDPLRIDVHTDNDTRLSLEYSTGEGKEQCDNDVRHEGNEKVEEQEDGDEFGKELEDILLLRHSGYDDDGGGGVDDNNEEEESNNNLEEDYM